MPYSVAPLALDDLDDIHAYLEVIDGWGAADSLIDQLYEQFSIIGANPGMGHRRRDLTDYDVFFWNALQRYAVIYRKSSPVEIVRVLAWRRLDPALLTPAGGLRM
ncbi:type II toxin-antitoxin system RelE/ParE family toxin [Skermanella rosea]|uniref:type II toxin-antitoxin system RelE/ParE family toxin n=1 Tax=Skermanella rosea TaxID=1817965 RepID=UPI0019337902|nr:type II toxin-antitoxin system RelE/ParE family toxin [Skermanella rosea]UEM02114.1 type II toxin-antitoxin system RelE/ParE family toxin [Skermanella rosea]